MPLKPSPMGFTAQHEARSATIWRRWCMVAMNIRHCTASVRASACAVAHFESHTILVVRGGLIGSCEPQAADVETHATLEARSSTAKGWSTGTRSSRPQPKRHNTKRMTEVPPEDPLSPTLAGSQVIAHVLDLLLDAICVVDADGRFVFVSAACERIFGYTAAEMIGRPMIDLVHPDDRARTLHAVDDIVAGFHQLHFENRYVRKDGRIVHIMWSARWSPEDRVRVAVARDVTERKRAESLQAALYAISEATYDTEDLVALFARVHAIVGALLPSQNFFIALHDREPDVLSFPYFVDEHQEAPRPSPLDDRTMSATVIRSGHPVHLVGDAQLGKPQRRLADVGDHVGQWLGLPLRTQNGVLGALVLTNQSSGSHYSQQDIELLQFVCVHVAASVERKQVETWLRHVAGHDRLTGLPNRELLNDRLRSALSRARRDRSHVAVLYVDLDHFKPINDTLGHATGDLVLREVAKRLSRCVRESDVVARMGGDEFVLILHDLDSADDARTVAAKICHALGEPFEVTDQRLVLTSSVGFALYPEHGDDDQLLVQRADAAMYRAKNEGGHRVVMAEAVVANA